MAGRWQPLYSAAVAVLGLVCVAVGAAAVGLPFWARFEDQDERYSGSESHERGYFGPWKLCKQLLYDRERCPAEKTRIKPNGAVRAAGVAAAVSVGLLGGFCVLSLLQMAMVQAKDRICMPYNTLVIVKLGLALLATLLAILAAGLFSLQPDQEGSIRITRGEAFYILIAYIILAFILFVLSLYDMLFSRRPGGDPTGMDSDPTGENATTYNNLGFRDRTSVSVTDASRKPYVNTNPTATNGSLVSMATTSSNGSTIGSGPRSPLRSSLKKPKPRSEEGMGIQNPGFRGLSPQLSRNGSVKKVRIQTHSTAV